MCEEAAKEALVELTKAIGRLGIEGVSGVSKETLQKYIKTVKEYQRNKKDKVDKLDKDKRELVRKEQQLRLYDTQWFHMNIDTSTRKAYEESVNSVLSEISQCIDNTNPHIYGQCLSVRKCYVDQTVQVTCFQLTTSRRLDKRCNTTKIVLPYIRNLHLANLDINLLEDFLLVGPLPRYATYIRMGYNSLMAVIDTWYHAEQESLKIGQWDDANDLLDRVRPVLDRASSDSTGKADLKAMIKHAFHITIARFLARLLSQDNIATQEGYKDNRKHLIILATFAALLCLLLQCYGDRFEVMLEIPGDF
jgi:hypothetical protein